MMYIVVIEYANPAHNRAEVFAANDRENEADAHVFYQSYLDEQPSAVTRVSLLEFDSACVVVRCLQRTAFKRNGGLK